MPYACKEDPGEIVHYKAAKFCDFHFDFLEQLLAGTPVLFFF